MCRRVDIVTSFKLPRVDVRLGANEAPGDAVHVRLSYSSNKGEDPNSVEWFALNTYCFYQSDCKEITA